MKEDRDRRDDRRRDDRRIDDRRRFDDPRDDRRRLDDRRVDDRRRDDHRDDRRRFDDRRREDQRDDRRENRLREDQRDDRKQASRQKSRSRSPRRNRRESVPRRDKISAHPKSSTIWIGSIPESAIDEDLYDVIEKFGFDIVGMKLISNRGFGYIRFNLEKEAREVLDYFSNHPMMVAGKKCRIDSCEDMPQLGHPYRPNMSKKPSACNTLFVGNLNMETTEDDIRNFFAPFQVVGIVMRKGGYKGMAFAHVKFDSVDDCHKAAERAGERLKGNRLRLDWAVEKSGMSSAPAGTTGEHSSRITEELRGQTPRIYVGSLTDSMNEDDIREAFSQFGDITLVKIHSDRRGNKSFGYVTFVSPQIASAAVDNGSSISVKGHRIRVDFARQEQRNAQQSFDMVQERRPVTRSPSPQYPRVTPVSYEVPSGYGDMKTWDEYYGKGHIGRMNGV